MKQATVNTSCPISTIHTSQAPRQPGLRRIARLRGLTSVEMLCAASISLTAISTSVGGMRDLVLRQHLEGAAHEIETSVQLARATAVLEGQTVRLAIQPINDATNTTASTARCLILHTGPKDACQCRPLGTAPVCTGDARSLQTQLHDGRSGVRIASNPVSLAFSATRGTVTPTATIKLVDSQGRALHQIVNVMGRTRTCSPAPALVGHLAC